MEIVQNGVTGQNAASAVDAHTVVSAGRSAPAEREPRTSRLNMVVSDAVMDILKMPGAMSDALLKALGDIMIKTADALSEIISDLAATEAEHDQAERRLKKIEELKRLIQDEKVDFENARRMFISIVDDQSDMLALEKTLDGEQFVNMPM